MAVQAPVHNETVKRVQTAWTKFSTARRAELKLLGLSFSQSQAKAGKEWQAWKRHGSKIGEDAIENGYTIFDSCPESQGPDPLSVALSPQHARYSYVCERLLSGEFSFSVKQPSISKALKQFHRQCRAIQKKKFQAYLLDVVEMIDFVCSITNKMPSNFSNTATTTTILESYYCVDGKKLNERYNKDERWELKNALRELNQKRICRHPDVKKIKNGCRIVNTKKWKCPRCQKELGRLTCAHVGEPVCKIIDRILNEHPKIKNLHHLYSILRLEHEGVIIAVCCDECNKSLEKHSTDSPQAEPSRYTVNTLVAPNIRTNPPQCLSTRRKKFLCSECNVIVKVQPDEDEHFFCPTCNYELI